MKQRRVAAEWNGPKVMVLHEKHGIVYMDASTEEAQFRSALRVLRGRLSMKDVWYVDDDEEFLVLAERAVTAKNGRAAWGLLVLRSCFEYERVELEDIATKYLSAEEDE
jgi:hypothetical protein